MKYVYGPVPFRRLGQSLGIDAIPLKTWNWNCVYSQLGFTSPLTNERREYIPSEDILAEAKRALKKPPSERERLGHIHGSWKTSSYPEKAQSQRTAPRTRYQDQVDFLNQ